MSEQNDTPDDNAILDVDPPIIQGWVSPVQPAGLAHGGVSISLAELEDPLGLRCLIDPWPDGRAVTPLAEDDRVNLYTDDSPLPVDGFTIPKGWTPQRIPLYVPKGTLRDGVNNIWVGVIRPSGNPKESIKLKVLFYRPGPTNLRLELPADVMANGIDSTRAADGVLFKVHYNARAYDTIRLLGNSAIRNRTVAPGETSPIELTLYTDFFTEVGDNPQAPFSFRAMTQLGDHEYSDVTYVDIHLNRTSLNPPKLVAPATNPIDALTYTNGVTVRVEHLPALTGDTAQLVEVNPPSGAVPFPEVPLNANKRANFTLSPEYLVQRHGDALSLFWIYSRNGVEIGRSEALRLQVMKIVDGDTRLPRPVITQAQGSVLDLSTFEGDATIDVDKWIGIKERQPTWMDAESGSNKHPVLNAHLVTSAEVTGGLRGKVLPRSWLEGLVDGSRLTIPVSVSFRGGASKEDSVFFPVPTYIVKNKPSIIEENFDELENIWLRPNESSEIPTMKISNLSSKTGCQVLITDNFAYMSPIPNKLFGKTLQVGSNDTTTNYTSHLRLEFKFTCSKISFWCHPNYDSSPTPTTIRIYRADGDLIKQETLKRYPLAQKHIEFLEYAAENIQRIEFTTGYGMVLMDYFTFTK